MQPRSALSVRVRFALQIQSLPLLPGEEGDIHQDRRYHERINSPERVHQPCTPSIAYLPGICGLYLSRSGQIPRGKPPKRTYSSWDGRSDAVWPMGLSKASQARRPYRPCGSGPLGSHDLLDALYARAGYRVSCFLGHVLSYQERNYCCVVGSKIPGARYWEPPRRKSASVYQVLHSARRAAANMTSTGASSPVQRRKASAPW